MITGRCMCGSVRYEAKREMLWAALCHCEDCQRAAGADYVSWFGVANDVLKWSGERAFHASSPGVRRSFCPTCGTPMSFESQKYPDETHLYAPSLEDRSLYKPTKQLFWDEHVAWLPKAWDLPRRATSSDIEVET